MLPGAPGGIRDTPVAPDGGPDLSPQVVRYRVRVTSILIVRHAQSTWNAQGRWQGRADPPLSELGERQAVEAAAKIGQVDAVVASPLIRAQRTAEIIAAELGVGPVAFHDDLAERDAGPWSGLTSAEIEAGWPGALAAGDFPEGFETDDVLSIRALRAIVAVHEAFEGSSVLVVSHGGVMLALERSVGVEGGRYPNLAGRHLRVLEDTLSFGDRVLLTVPTGGSTLETSVAVSPE